MTRESAYRCMAGWLVDCPRKFDNSTCPRQTAIGHDDTGLILAELCLDAKLRRGKLEGSTVIVASQMLYVGGQSCGRRVHAADDGCRIRPRNGGSSKSSLS